MKNGQQVLVTLGVPAAAVVSDQVTKYLANQSPAPGPIGPFDFVLHQNYGFMLGTLAELPPLFTVVMPATIGAFLLFLYFVLQYFLPIQSLLFRGSLGLFLGGILGNIVDRVRHSYVTDFLVFESSWFATGVFNVGDALQWVGVIFFFISFVGHGKVFYPIDQRRGRLWIDTAFQLRYCGILVALGAGFALIAGVLSYTFLRVSLGTSTASAPVLQAFVWTFLAATAAFLVVLFLIGVKLSHRIIGPVQSFGRFLDDLLRGHNRVFTLRKGDEFREFEAVAGRFSELFQERLDLPPLKLAVGDAAPSFSAKTLAGPVFDVKEFEGKKAWLIFYRFVGCPLCTVHLKDFLKVIREAVDHGIVVLAIYESTPEEFAARAAEHPMTMLNQSGARIVPDPDRTIYRLYRTGSNRWVALHPKALWGLARAAISGFRQGAIGGRLGRLPAHVFLDRQGKIQDIHYGAHNFDHVSLRRIQSFVNS